MTAATCTRCRTELPPGTLACPGCGALVHSETLKRLAADAEAAATRGELAAARGHWSGALEVLPAQSLQHAKIRARISELNRQLDAIDPARRAVAPADGRAADGRWWGRGAAAAVAVTLLLVGKLKFLLLGLTKASTFVSMFAFFGVYWSAYGWPLALGLVLSIYIHEMGHVAMLRKLGIESGAPMFIPGVGALVMLKQRVDDPLTDAKIGLAGPVWGLGAALAALAIFAVTGAPIWLAIAQLTGFINLFNLTPVWQLDGSRGVHVLARGERWVLVAAIAAAFSLTGQRLLLLVAAVAIWRALQQEVGPGDSRTLAVFTSLVAALALLARGVG